MQQAAGLCLSLCCVVTAVKQQPRWQGQWQAGWLALQMVQPCWRRLLQRQVVVLAWQWWQLAAWQAAALLQQMRLCRAWRRCCLQGEPGRSCTS